MIGLPLRPAAALLSRRALSNNIRAIRARIRENQALHHSRADILAIVKADAYGHDLNLVMPELQKLGIRHFAVASLEEGLEARRVSSRAEILVLGGTLRFSRSTLEVLKKNRLHMSVCDLEALRFFCKHPSIPIHLKLDTGMNRLGLRPEEWGEALSLLKSSKRKLEGLFTHFATAEDRIFERQAVLFEEVSRWFWTEGFRPKFVHSENTSALFGQNKLKRGFLSEVGNLVRPGVSMYGYTCAGDSSKLQPVLELVSEIGLVKPVEVGEGISYGHLYRAEKSHRYGIVTLGYADGLSKAYAPVLQPQWRSSKGKFKGWLNICGAICMDMVMVRSKRSLLKAQDRVVFWGRFPNKVLEKNLVEPYELNLRISKRIPRIWVD
jgi:alanine racemase